MKYAHTIIIACLFLVAPVLTSAADCGVELPWKKLRFEQKSLWLTARSEVELIPYCGTAARDRLTAQQLQPGSGGLWEMRAESSVGSSLERLTLLMNPADLQLYRKERFSSGKQSRVKEHRYSEDGIARTRRDPAPGEESRQPKHWSKVSNSTVHLSGEKRQASPLTASHALLLASSDPELRSEGASRVIYIHTDHNIYSITLQNSGLESIDSHHGVASSSISGRRQAHRLSVTSADVGRNDDKYDFDLLGLGGELSILVDHETGIPLLIRGRAPRIGKTEVKLVAAEL